MKIIKLIFTNVPILFKWLIPTVFITPIITLIVINFVQDKEIDISWQNLKVILIITIGSFIIASIWSVISTINQLINKVSDKNIRKSTTVKSKIILPYKTISIGKYTTTNICVDILANIYLIEKEVKPTSSQFLKRITIDSPYCPICNNGLNILHGSWQIDGVQIGYKCKNCNTEIKKYRNDLIREVKTEVRNNYDIYWKNYVNEIKRITKGKPEEYEIPK